jgi:hypothetical protein
MMLTDAEMLTPENGTRNYRYVELDTHNEAIVTRNTTGTLRNLESEVVLLTNLLHKSAMQSLQRYTSNDPLLRQLLQYT